MTKVAVLSFFTIGLLFALTGCLATVSTVDERITGVKEELRDQIEEAAREERKAREADFRTMEQDIDKEFWGVDNQLREVERRVTAAEKRLEQQEKELCRQLGKTAKAVNENRKRVFGLESSNPNYTAPFIVEFATGEVEIKGTVAAQMQLAARYIRDNTLTVQHVIGCSSKIRGATSNEYYAKKRAENVHVYLVANATERISSSTDILKYFVETDKVGISNAPNQCAVITFKN